LSNKLSVFEYKLLGKQSKQKKFGNIINFRDGDKFDSKKEMNRYLELCIRKSAGEIKSLDRQRVFLLIPKQEDERPVTYKSDFYYYDNFMKQEVVEDVKSVATKKIASYIIKRKLFKIKYPDIIFLET